MKLSDYYQYQTLTDEQKTTYELLLLKNVCNEPYIDQAYFQTMLRATLKGMSEETKLDIINTLMDDFEG